jgi:hypothetical protein
MRWTIRGIPTDTADAVRDVAFETGSTLGDVVMLCVQYGLSEAQRRLEADNSKETEVSSSISEIHQMIDEIRRAFSLPNPEQTK